MKPSGSEELGIVLSHVGAVSYHCCIYFKVLSSFSTSAKYFSSDELIFVKLSNG